MNQPQKGLLIRPETTPEWFPERSKGAQDSSKNEPQKVLCIRPKTTPEWPPKRSKRAPPKQSGQKQAQGPTDTYQDHPSWGPWGVPRASLERSRTDPERARAPRGASSRVRGCPMGVPKQGQKSIRTVTIEKIDTKTRKRSISESRQGSKMW